MGKVFAVQTNFSAGEINPNLAGRTDAERYASAAKEIRNAWVRVSGGVYRRHGTRYVYGAKNDTGTIRLIPWIFNTQQTYVVELTDGKARFYQNGQIVFQADGVTPYEIDTGISGDKLERLSYAQGQDTMFFAHPGMHPKRLVRHDQINWTCDDIPFTVAAFDEVEASPSTGWATADVNDHIGQVAHITLADSDKGAAYTGTGFKASDVGGYITIYGGVGKITAVTDKAHATIEWREIMTVAAGTTGTGSSTTLTWPPAPVDNWRIQTTCWSDTLGWPACVVLHQQRLVFAGSNKYPLTLWGSRIKDYFNFELGALDNAAYSFTLSSDQVNPIIHLFSMNALVALTGAGEYLLGGVITPTNVSVKVPSNFGAHVVRPVRVGTELLYMQRGSRKMLAMTYDPESQTAYEINEMSLLAEHMTEESLIIAMSAHTQPDNLIHLLRDDGKLISITANKQVGIVGWTMHETEGAFLSLATVPRGDGVDDCYVAVARPVGSGIKVYVEHFLAGVYTDSGITGQIANSTDPAQTVWSKLEHLEGHTVDILADGVPQPRQVVHNGQVTLVRPARHVEIGLPFTSRIKLLKADMQTGLGDAHGMVMRTSNLRLKFLGTSGCTVGDGVTQDEVPFRKFGHQVLNSPSPIYTGVYDVGKIGDENELVIEQPQPLPFHLLSVIRTLVIN